MRFPNPIRWVKLQNRREDRRRLNEQRRLRHTIAAYERATEGLDRRRWNTPAAFEWVAMTRQLWRCRAIIDRLKTSLEAGEPVSLPPLPPYQTRRPAFVLRGGVLHPLGQQQEGN